MSIEELWKILDREKKSEALQALDINFYLHAAEYIRELEKERAKVGEAQKIRVIDDELKSARRALEDILDWRIRKMQEEALSKARGFGAEIKGLTEYEAEIFEGVQKSIEIGRRKILGMIVSGEPPKKTDGFERSSKEFLMVRTLREIPAFVGTNGRTYKVAHGEVIMLPKANVEALCKKGAAVVVNRRNNRNNK